MPHARPFSFEDRRAFLFPELLDSRQLQYVMETITPINSQQAAQLRYRLKHKDRIKERMRLYRERNREKLNKQAKDYRATNAEVIKVRRKARRNKDTEFQRKWRASNPDKLAHYRNQPYQHNAANDKSRRLKFMAYQYAIKEYYGCVNPACEAPVFHPCQLDFHHIDDEAKLYNISQMSKLSIAVIAEEISKCCVLCANCHRLATWAGLDCTGFNKCNIASDGKVVGPV